MRIFLYVVVALALGVLGAGYVWLNTTLDLSTPTVDLSIEPGASARDVAQAVADTGISVSPLLLHGWFRLSGQSRQIRAGSYELDSTTTPQSLLQKLVRGEEALRSVTLVEGWTFRQVREALKKAEKDGMSQDDAKKNSVKVQELTDKLIKEIDASLASKEAEINKV